MAMLAPWLRWNLSRESLKNTRMEKNHSINRAMFIIFIIGLQWQLSGAGCAVRTCECGRRVEALSERSLAPSGVAVLVGEAQRDFRGLPRRGMRRGESENGVNDARGR